jgi:hypothetical protein
MDFGVKTSSIRNLVAGTAIAGAIGLTLTSTKDSRTAKKELAQKLNAISENVNLKVAQVQGSGSQAGKEFNRNDGNAFSANTTYHSYTWDYCENWIGEDLCEKWLDPYVSQHGFTGDQSVLEGKVASLYQQMKETYKGDGGKYALWDIKLKSGESLKDEQGRLNRKALTQFSLTKEAREAIESVGVEAARAAMAETFDEKDSKDTMPNMESLRAIAKNLTISYRNNLVAKLGEIRRMKKGVEMTGGENYAGCDALADETDEHPKQGELSDEAKNAGFEQRMQLCKQMMSASVSDINPAVKDGQVVSGDASDEQVDEWRARVNIAVLDNLGVDPNSIPKPSDATLTEREISSEMISYSKDGTKEEIVYETPKAQIEAYNEMLETAAKQQAEISKSTIGHLPNLGQNIRKNKITPGQVSAVEINGLTKQMKNDLKGEQVVGANVKAVEMTPEELIQTANQQ